MRIEDAENYIVDYGKIILNLISRSDLGIFCKEILSKALLI